MEFDFALFQEPEGFRPSTPPPTEHEFVRRRENVLHGTPETLQFSLVGSHRNAGVFLAEYLDANKHLIQGKRVLELGAGAGLPSMISALNGAKRVITTDYPDKPLIDRLRHNIDQNLTGEYSNRVDVQGYLWGSDPAPLLKSICSTEEDIEDSEDKFDVIIMCDLIFNHSQHQNMLKTCLDCLAPGGIIYAAFTHHRPWLADKDMAMFPLASQMGFEYQLEMMHKMPVMFNEDPGDEEIRSTVKFYTLWRP